MTGEHDPDLRDGSGAILVADFCRATGLDEPTVAGLMRAGTLEGSLFDGAGRPFGLIDHTLPSAARLRELGLAVREDYDPEEHRSSTPDDEDDPEEPDDSAWSWKLPDDGRDAHTTSSTRVYENPWWSVREDEVRRPDGSRGTYAVLDAVDQAIVIALEDDRIQLVEQDRHPIGTRSWELPSGSADPARDVGPDALAARELAEETGLTAATWTALGVLDVMPSTTSQRCWVYLATDLRQGEPDRDAEEADLEAAWFTREHLEQMIADGSVTDAKTCAAYALLLLHERRRRRVPLVRRTVYVDMVGDLFHAGHVVLLRAARELGDRLVVGVLSDESAAAYKRPPVMTLAERVAVIEACRYVDDVVAGAPPVLTEAFLAQHGLDLVVHGDDLGEEAAASVYGPAVDTGRLRLVPRSTGISTTEVIARVHGRDD